MVCILMLHALLYHYRMYSCDSCLDLRSTLVRFMFQFLFVLISQAKLKVIQNNRLLLFTIINTKYSIGNAYLVWIIIYSNMKQCMHNICHNILFVS
jgi:hypothetical protein